MTSTPASLCTALLLVSCAALAAQPDARDGDATYELPLPAPVATSVAESDFGMVASGSPEATDAGVAILEAGGNAIDAAVAVALTLGVSDPDASGLGGMTYLLIRLADGRALAIDGSPPIPRAVDLSRLQELSDGGRLVGHALAAVPTTLAVLELARARYGTLSLSELVRPAIETAERGYRLGPLQIVWTEYYLNQILGSDSLRWIAEADGDTRDEGSLRIGKPGDLRCRPDLARTMRSIQREGAATFYRGAIADQIEADMRDNGGFLRKLDLVLLRVRERAPVSTTYRGRRVESFPPPGGGAVLIEILNILEAHPTSTLAVEGWRRQQLLIEAVRIAFADRSAVLGGPFGPFSTLDGTTSKEHARRRAREISLGSAIPDDKLAPPLSAECAETGDSTTHFAVVDRWGNVVSATQTLGRSWGAKVAAPGLGFPYNGLLEAINYTRPQCPGYLEPTVARTTEMAPTIVETADGTLLAALGAPSSARIPSIVAGVISNLVDRGMDLRAAVEAPRVVIGGFSSAGVMAEIAPPLTDRHIDTIEAVGFGDVTRLHYPPEIRRIVLFGGVNAVGWDAPRAAFVGIGDGRRWGSARGPRVVAEAAPQP